MAFLSSGIPQEFLGSGIPRVRGSWASKGGEHPRVVLGRPEGGTHTQTLGNGQLSLIFGVPTFCAFSPPIVA